MVVTELIAQDPYLEPFKQKLLERCELLYIETNYSKAPLIISMNMNLVLINSVKAIKNLALM
jgi:hypothetical protein